MVPSLSLREKLDALPKRAREVILGQDDAVVVDFDGDISVK